jgi:ubiquinone/menaquinone biosynthesis C-methylase UbiE
VTRPRVDYDDIAPTYDRRYDDPAREGSAGVIGLLSEVVGERKPARALEVGCGSGHWLSQLSTLVPRLYGLDFSMGMLGKARERGGDLRLVRATASRLPFPAAALDLLFCVNALHHFDDPRSFVAEAARCLGDEGTLISIGMSPRTQRDRWYLYDYFPGTYETDLGRYPSSAVVTDWMIEAGFRSAEARLAHRILHQFVGAAVLDDPTLAKNGTSQLALLSDEAYAGGRQRIDAAIERDPGAIFPVDISLVAVIGGKSPLQDPGAR